MRAVSIIRCCQERFVREHMVAVREVLLDKQLVLRSQSFQLDSTHNYLSLEPLELNRLIPSERLAPAQRREKLKL